MLTRIKYIHATEGQHSKLFGKIFTEPEMLSDFVRIATCADIRCIIQHGSCLRQLKDPCWVDLDKGRTSRQVDRFCFCREEHYTTYVNESHE